MYVDSFVNRSGKELPQRYSTAIRQLSNQLWRKYPSIVDPADRDSCMELTLRRVADHEAKHGEAADLHALIWRIFPEVATSLLRRSRYKLPLHTVAHPTLDALAPNLGDNTQTIEDRIYAAQLLKTFDERTSDILHLKFFDDLSVAEISRKLHISEANVRQICHRALEQLRRRQQPESEVDSE